LLPKQFRIQQRPERFGILFVFLFFWSMHAQHFLNLYFLSPSCRLNIHHKDGMRQPDMAFNLCQESDHLPEAGGGCSGTPFRNFRILIPCVVGHLPGKLHTIPSDFNSQ
jgi:hypothetical protein